jgi:sugar O-acyltransferase (sialic acid O-acetyltransferase NeuD family)
LKKLSNILISKNKTLLYGASGHAKVICSIFESNDVVVAGIFDDNENIVLDKYYVINGYDCFYEPELPVLISIGDNSIRKQISEKVSHSFSTAIHFSSVIDDVTKIGLGTAVFHSATIQRDTLIGKHCIINTNASVDHDCIIEDYVHVAPSATLCGNIKVGEGTLIGANSTILPNITIGKWCVIGAGAVVTNNIPDYSLVVGVPGNIVRMFKNV